VILVIDTSSPSISVVGTIDQSRMSETISAGRGLDLHHLKGLVQTARITKIAVASGPGSFTGLRVGVSFGLGLAIGLRIPIVPLPALGIQAARADAPVLAVTEAGRGRVYYQSPDGGRGVAEPGELRGDWPVVGWLRPKTQAALEALGLRMLDEPELRTFGVAAARLLESAAEVAYGSVKVEYMQSFSARTP
jgi:hypothetical protein